MSAAAAADAFCAEWSTGDFRFGIINFANPDMVGHTGDVRAAIAGIETVDGCLRRVVATVLDAGGACIVTADHGNAEQMIEPDGSPDTAHTTNPVPLLVTVVESTCATVESSPTSRRRRSTCSGSSSRRDDGQRCGARDARAAPDADDPERLRFEILARDGDARAGVLHTPHGPVETPCFVPLATRGSVKGLLAEEVAEVGYRMVLGNTYHLMLAPGGQRIAELGGLHEFMAWDRAIISDSGGFQVFSLAHGAVADEVKGRRGRPPLQGGVLEIAEAGVRFRSYLDGSEHFLSPERSMEVQRDLGSDIALAFDECTPFRADRDYTARSTERTHRWLQRCLDWHGEHGPPHQAVFGIVRVAPTRSCAANRPPRCRPPASTASRSAARSAATRSRCEALSR